MEARLDLKKYVMSGPGRAMLHLQKEVDAGGLDKTLVELVKIRASQLNGCAYCLDMHTKDARALGETEQRIYCLPAWREAPFYTDRERAALQWAEAVTRIGETHAEDEIWERVRPFFSEEEMLYLTFQVAAINVWNRLAVSFRAPAGTYQPQPHGVTAGR